MGVLVGPSGLGLLECGRLAQMVDHELLLERLVRSLGEERLFLQDAQNTHGLLKHVDTFLQVHAEVHHSPLDA